MGPLAHESLVQCLSCLGEDLNFDHRKIPRRGGIAMRKRIVMLVAAIVALTVIPGVAVGTIPNNGVI